jgi:hypothetical protein
MSISKHNSEGYDDPTAYAALSMVHNEEVRTGNGGYPRTYICSPFAGNIAQNTANAIRYCRFALKCERLPIAPHLLFPRFMNDANPDERNLAISFGIRLLGGCREIWVFGDRVSKGMQLEIRFAMRKRIPVRFFDKDCKEANRHA